MGLVICICRRTPPPFQRAVNVSASLSSCYTGVGNRVGVTQMNVGCVSGVTQMDVCMWGHPNECGVWEWGLPNECVGGQVEHRCPASHLRANLQPCLRSHIQFFFHRGLSMNLSWDQDFLCLANYDLFNLQSNAEYTIENEYLNEGTN